jgi:hypothetical protein
MTPARPAGHPPTRSLAQPAAHGQEAGAPPAAATLAGQAPSAPAHRESRLRTGASARPSPSRRSVAEHRYSLARRLTDRDRAFVAAVARHRVLTGPHVEELFFESGTRARRRLVTLYRLGVLDRFQPYRPSWGSQPFHYVLGPLGAAVLAAERGDDPDAAARRWRGERTLALGRTQRLAHLVAVNAFFVALAAHARRQPEARLIEWLTEAECARWTEGIVRPDAFGTWAEGGASVEFFLEHDRGTETLARLGAKLTAYERLEAERTASSWVLFTFLTPRREAAARRALVGATVPVATAVLGPTGRPHEPVWLALGAPGPRCPLAGLAAFPKPLEATRRAATTSPRAWRFQRSRPDDHEEEVPIETS